MKLDYTPTWSRAFLFLDEWLGVCVLLYAWRVRDWALLFAFGIPWAVAVYVVGYRMQWAFERQAWRRDTRMSYRGDGA